MPLLSLINRTLDESYKVNDTFVFEEPLTLWTTFRILEEEVKSIYLL